MGSRVRPAQVRHHVGRHRSPRRTHRPPVQAQDLPRLLTPREDPTTMTRRPTLDDVLPLTPVEAQKAERAWKNGAGDTIIARMIERERDYEAQAREFHAAWPTPHTQDAMDYATVGAITWEQTVDLFRHALSAAIEEVAP